MNVGRSAILCIWLLPQVVHLSFRSVEADGMLQLKWLSHHVVTSICRHLILGLPIPTHHLVRGWRFLQPCSTRSKAMVCHPARVRRCLETAPHLSARIEIINIVIVQCMINISTCVVISEAPTNVWASHGFTVSVKLWAATSMLWSVDGSIGSQL